MLANLKVSAKLALFGAGAVALGLVLAGMRFAADRAEAAAAERAAAATECLQALSGLFQRVAEHRGLAAQLLAGVDVRAEVARKRQEVEAAFDRVLQLDRAHGQPFCVTDSLLALREAWTRMSSGLASLSGPESFDQHTRLIAGVLDAMRRVARTSGIGGGRPGAAPQLGQVVAGTLPRAVEQLGQLRALGSGALARGTVSSSERAALREKLAAAALLDGEARRQLEDAFAADPRVRAELLTWVQVGDRLVHAYLQAAREWVVEAEVPTGSPRAYFSAATRAIDARFQLLREAAGLLRAVEEERAAAARRAAMAVAGTSLLLVVVLAVLGAAVVRSVTEPLGQLVRGLERVGRGDLQVELGLPGTDELALVAQTFDQVTARLRTSARQQELLRALATALNRHLALEPMFAEACPLVRELVGARSVWVFVLDGASFRLAGADGVPAGLAEDHHRELRWQPCRCQERLLRGELQEPLVVLDCLRLEKLRGELADPVAAQQKTSGAWAHASVPIRSGDRTVGLLNYLAAPGIVVGEESLRLAELIGRTLGVAVERVRLHEEAERARQRERAAAAGLARTLLGVVDLERVGSETLAVLREFLQPDGAALLVRDPSQRWLELAYGFGWPEGYRWVPLASPATDPVAWAVVHRRSTVQDLGVPELPFSVPAALRSHGVRTCVVVPLLADRGITGALVLAYTTPRALRAEELAVAVELAGVAGVAVERALEHRQNRVLFEEVPVGLYRSTPDGRFLDVNRVLVRMLGYPDRESLLRTPASELYVDPEDRTRWQELMHREGTVVGFETYWRRRDGSVLAVRESARVVRDAAGEPACYEGAVEDVTARKQLEANLYLVANHDGLTGLLNARRFREEVARAVGQARSTGGPVAVLVLDLDHFKDINSRLGPSQGDEVLRRAAEVLRRGLSPEAALARLGGDSFGLCVPGAGLQQASQLGQLLLGKLSQAGAEVGGVRVPLAASCGVALFPDHAQHPEELLVLAEVAMYAAKAQGRGRLVQADPDPAWRARYRVPVEELAELREAVARGELRAFVQPILDLRSGEVSRYELLARLHKPDGIVEAARFIDLAERGGLAADIDVWVCREAARLARKWPALRVHVNLSASTLRDPGALRRLLEVGDELGELASRVVLEVTERIALADVHAAIEAAHQLRSKGFQLALDDFGTGISSLYLLRHLPVDYVKVDRSFVHNLTRDVHNRSIVRSAVELCAGSGRAPVAEGVEDAETLELLRELGVHYAQGYYVGRPARASEVFGE